MLLQIALFEAPYLLLDYKPLAGFPEDFWKPGLRVAVPLARNGLKAGIVVDILADSQISPGIVYKEIIWPLERKPLLDDDTLKMCLDLATRQGIESGRIFGNLLPAGLRRPDLKLKFSQGVIPLRALLRQGKKEAVIREFLAGEAILTASSSWGNSLCVLCVDPPWPVRPAATKQRAILDCLYENGSLPRNLLVKKLCPESAAALNKLVENRHVKIISECEEEENFLPPVEAPFALNAVQRNAVEELKAALHKPEAACMLLHGVTGSGKTAVYAEIIRECLQGGKSAFLLAPEVALAHKLYRDFKISLPDWPIILYHGYQTAGAREKTWKSVAEKTSPSLIIGTRSALFLPARNAGLVILDEEHDSSYKQDEVFPYHAKELAWFRMHKNRGLLVPGSATPDIKTFYASKTGKIKILAMPARIGSKPLPPVELVQLGKNIGDITAGGINLLAPETEQALKECMERGDQSVILLNRRGYAPMLYCRDCAKTLRCPHCAIGLAYHKDMSRLVCHYCGYSLPWPAACPECGKNNFLSLGEGTERIAERLEALSGRPALRLDRDSARRPGRLEEILSTFAKGESPFLTGTQMLSKGHHFPKVTLAVVADGDIGLNLPDYRASERVFQLLVQAAGRAGRGDLPGRVIIQTRNPDHYCWKYVRNYDYEGFYVEELERRRKRRYPPFVCLGLLRISWPMEDEGAQPAMLEMATDLRKKSPAFGVNFLGPAPAPISYSRGRQRWHCLLKADNWSSIREIWFLAKKHKKAAGLRLFLDLDPVDML